MVKQEKERAPALRFPGFSGEWETRKLSEISNKVNKKNADNTYSEVLTNSAEFGIISQSDFFDKDIATQKNLVNYYIIEPNDFVYNPRISNYAPVGPINRNKLGRHGIMSPLYYVFETYDVEPAYLEYYFKTSYWHRFMVANANTGARSDRFAIKNKDFEKMPIPYPTLSEQEQIGNFFKALDDEIQVTREKADQLTRLKRGLLQQLFPQKGEDQPRLRFPGFTDVWEQCQLKDVAERVRDNDGRMNLPTLTISAAQGWLSQKDRFSKDISGKEKKNYTLLRRGDLSYNRGNSKVAMYGVVYELNEYEEALVPRIYHSFRVTKGDSTFIEYMFESKRPDRELRKLVASSARMDGMLNISFDNFFDINIQVPSVKEQEQIGKLFQHLDQYITQTNQKLALLNQQKQAFLQQMFI